MKINKEGLEIIKKSESLGLKTYTCAAGKKTIGWGHTGNDVKYGMIISEDTAERLLKKDISRFEDGVSELLKIKTTSNEFSAMVCLAFNIGLGNFAKSEVLINHNKDKTLDACKAFHNWRKGGGKKLKGLVRRRLKEAELYIK